MALKLEDIYRSKVIQKGPIVSNNLISESIYIPQKRADTQPKKGEPRGLGSIYGQKVAGTGKILYTTGGDVPVEKIADPKSLQLESSVNTKMMDALKAVVPNPPKTDKPYSKAAGLSYEDALKELSEFANKQAR